MSTHEGVSCDACQKSNFKGKRFKCLQCFDYDLCAECYEQKVTTGRHLSWHPMQCLLTTSDISIYYAGENVRKHSWSYTCPLCGLKGFNEETMTSHVSENHPNDFTEVICPICASVPGFEPNQMVEFFVNHMNSNIHQTCDENTTVRVRQRVRGSSSNRNRRSQFNSNANNSAPSGSGSGSNRESQIGSVAQFLTQITDNRLANRSYAPGQQTISSSSRQQGSSNCERFMIPKWNQMRAMDEAPWEGKKNDSLTTKALYKKDDTPWLRNPPPNLNEEPSEEVSFFEMDRSVFVIQLLLSTLSIEVPLHGTDPVPKRQLFDEQETEPLNEQPQKSVCKKSIKMRENSEKATNQGPKNNDSKLKITIPDVKNDNTNSGDNDDDDEDEESGGELSEKDDSENEDDENSDGRTLKNGDCDGLKRRTTHRNKNSKNSNSKPYLRLNSAPPTSGSATLSGQRTVTGHTTKPLLPTSSTNVQSVSQVRASKVRSASLNSSSSISSLATTMRSTLGPMAQSGAMNVVSPTGRRRNFAPASGTVGGGGGGIVGHGQRQHPESSSN